LQKFAERKSVACSFKNIQKMGEKIELTKELAIDCEFVRGLAGEREISLLARVSIVNANGKCIMDKFVKPTQKVVNYCTFVSGIRPCDLINADPFDKVQCEVAKIIDGRILVGHALDNDLLVLKLTHPQKLIRDTSDYLPLQFICRNSLGRRPALKTLAKEVLGINIQQGEHNSVIDAKTTMQIYNIYKKQWEASLFLK
uniref:RNA exonuclease 4 n=1 Tax=Dracunculus medinensis TaxID=318479 RepID=A0A0N4U3P1_DRAME